MSAQERTTQKVDLWKKYFHYEDLETANKKFDFAINTDGVSVSFQMRSTNGNGEESEQELPFDIEDDNESEYLRPLSGSNLPLVQRRFNDNYYDTFAALDPGRRLPVAGKQPQLTLFINKQFKQHYFCLLLSGVRRNSTDIHADCAHIKLRNTKFHHLTGFYSRKRKQRKLCGKIDRMSYSQLSPMNSDYRVFYNNC